MMVRRQRVVHKRCCLWRASVRSFLVGSTPLRHLHHSCSTARYRTSNGFAWANLDAVALRATLALAFAVALLGCPIQAEQLANGLAFQTPDGWALKTNAEAAVLLPSDLVMEPGGQDPSELYVVTLLPGVSDLQDPQLLATVQGQFFPAEAQMRAVGAPQAFRAGTGTGFLYCFDGVSQGIAVRVQLYVVGLSGGGVAALVALARPALLARREATIAAVAASFSRQVDVAAPGGQDVAVQDGPRLTSWAQRLRGKKLYQFSGYSSGYGSGGVVSQKTLVLGDNGTYEYRRSGSVSVYVEGASGGSVSQGGERGRWRIYEQGGKVLLELVSTNGTTENIELTSDGNKTLLNGRRWLVSD